ncbi:MAG: Smr/MutS family protein [Bacteroidales bacterium]|nr:Smr/MutS family protein [Bacteroidales bacterium]
MKDYIQHLEEKIGFGQIREMVAQECVNTMALRFVEQMSFSNNYNDIVCNLAQTDEFRQILLMENNFPSQDFFDLTSELSRLRTIGTTIDLQALFDLKCSLRTVFDCVRFFQTTEDSKYPRLKVLVEKVELDPWVLKECNSIIDDKGNIYDTASELLADIRRQQHRKQNDIDRLISKTLGRAKQEGWAPENAEVTIRNGRAVIPMLDTHRRKIKGLIIDESATRQTAYLEPSEVVELNNDLRELEFAERREIERILHQFTDNIRPILPQLLTAYWVLGKIDFIRAKARFALRIDAGMPIVDNCQKIYWFDAHHPLLYLNLSKQNKEVVPFGIELNENQRMVIISGPNSGGKSVCLKAVGLLQYMLQTGLLVPVKETSEFGVFNRLFIDIGDQQSIENDLSTYSSHLMNMKTLLDVADGKTLFLLDELGAGTEPRIGGAIAEAMVEMLYEKNSFGVITTHYSNLKLMADKYPAIANAAMLFDTERMKPLYKLVVKHPGSSFAFEIAKNIGLPNEILIAAEKKVGTDMLNFEHQLQQIEVEKQEIEKQRTELSVADTFLSEMIEKYTHLNNTLELKKHEILSAARQNAKQIIADANKKIEHTIAEIKTAQAKKEETLAARQNLQQEVAKIETEQKSADENAAKIRKSKKHNHTTTKTTEDNDIINNSPIALGDIVKIDDQDTYGQVVEIKGKKVTIESNSIRMLIPIDRLVKTKKKVLPTAKAKDTSYRYQSIYNDLNAKRAAFSPTLDLRGKRGDEAMQLLEHYIDEAMLLSEKEIRVLHGTGYGILKEMVRSYLRNHREVKRFHPEVLELGGEGITVIELK